MQQKAKGKARSQKKYEPLHHFFERNFKKITVDCFKNQKTFATRCDAVLQLNVLWKKSAERQK